MTSTRTFIYRGRQVTVSPRLLGYRWHIAADDAAGISPAITGRALTRDSAIDKATARVDQLNSRIRLRAIMQAHWAER